MKRISSMCAIVLIGAFAAPVDAGFSFNGPDGGPSVGEVISFKMRNFEVVLDADISIDDDHAEYSAADILNRAQSGGVIDDVGDELYGIGTITSITSLDGSKTYWVPTADQRIDLRFYDYIVKTLPVDLGSGNFSEAKFTGGAVDFFFDGNGPDFTSDPGPFKAGWGGAIPDETTAHSGIALSNGVGNAGDTLFMSTVGIGGIDSSVTDADVTLRSSFTAFPGAGAGRVTGVGDGFLDVTFSELPFTIDFFDPSTAGPASPYPGEQDMTLKSNFDTLNPQEQTDEEDVSGWSLRSEDPLNIRYVPEPSSLFLWLSLFAISMLCRRQTRQ